MHINSKFNKLRDRLRHRLNEKRTIDKKEAPMKEASIKESQQPAPVAVNAKVNLVKKEKVSKQQVLTNQAEGKNTNEDTRDIKDLLEFIEGTDKETKVVKEHKRELKRLKKEKRVIVISVFYLYLTSYFDLSLYFIL